MQHYTCTPINLTGPYENIYFYIYYLGYLKLLRFGATGVMQHVLSFAKGTVTLSTCRVYTHLYQLISITFPGFPLLYRFQILL